MAIAASLRSGGPSSLPAWVVRTRLVLRFIFFTPVCLRIGFSRNYLSERPAGRTENVWHRPASRVAGTSSGPLEPSVGVPGMPAFGTRKDGIVGWPGPAAESGTAIIVESLLDFRG